jgi:uroporphyrinogen-III decarboxylase
MGQHAVLASNLDPVRSVRDGTPESIAAALAQCRQDVGGNFIVAAGCEIPRGTPDANLFAMRDFVNDRTVPHGKNMAVR